MNSQNIDTTNYTHERIKELSFFDILDSTDVKDFEMLTHFTAEICDMPMAWISFIEDEKQFFKATVGIDLEDCSLKDSICQYTISGEQLLEIKDIRNHKYASELKAVTSDEKICFYAGTPIRTQNGKNIGTVCIADYEPRELSSKQRFILNSISKQTVSILEKKRKNEQLKNELAAALKKKLNERTHQLSDKEKEYDLIYNVVSNSGVIIEIDAEGKIRKVNAYFTKLTGIEPQEIVGRDFESLLSDDISSLKESFWNAIDEQERKVSKIKLISKDDEEIWLRTSLNPLLDNDGKVRGVVLVAQDISSEVVAQQRLLEAKKIAEETSIQKDKFIANMSHEIRTPINAIIGFTELLMEENCNEHNENYLNPIKNAGDKLLYIVNDILDLSKIETGVFQIDRRPFNIEEVVQKVFSILELTAHKKKIEFSYEIDEKVPEHVYGDNNRLAQILINLLGNAIKFTDQGFVRLYIEETQPSELTAPNETNIQFKVSDSGIGISKNSLDKIFDRFSQENRETSVNYGGTGLGLNISQLLVQKQKGELKVFSEKNRGSDFVFNIPYKPVTKISRAYKYENAEEIETSVSKVLLCEDNVLNQNLVKAIVTTTNYELDIAKDGIEALDKITTGSYDLILMDIQMPHKNGYKVVKEMRNKLGLNTPVIGISAHSMIKEKKKCLDIGMNDYLAKPYTRKELLSKIQYWIAQEENCLQDIGLNVDAEKLKVISEERLNELSNGDDTTKKKLVAIYIEESKQNKANLWEYAENNQREELKELLHKLKTSFGLIGASAALIDFFERALENMDTNLKKIAKCLILQIEMLETTLKNKYPTT